MNTSRQSHSSAIRPSTAASTPSLTTMTQADAVAMIRWRCQKPSHIETADSHFFYERRVPQHQSWGNAAIGDLKKGSTIAEPDSDLNVTTLYGDDTYVFRDSARPFHTRIKEKYTVRPPGNKEDNHHISRLFVTAEGMYSVKFEKDLRLRGKEGGSSVWRSRTPRNCSDHPTKISNGPVEMCTGIHSDRLRPDRLRPNRLRPNRLRPNRLRPNRSDEPPLPLLQWSSTINHIVSFTPDSSLTDMYFVTPLTS